MKRVLRALGVAILLLLVAEAVTQAFWGRGPGVDAPQGLRPLYREHPTRLWALQPGATTSSEGVEYRLNRLGLRGAEPTGRGGVLLLGDSCVFGLGVPEDQTIPAVLERELGRPVWNGGVPGYSSAQGLRLAREILPAIQPDVVVFAYLANDLSNGTLPDHEALPGPSLGFVRGLLWESSLFQLGRQVPNWDLPERFVEFFTPDRGGPMDDDAEPVRWVMRADRERFRANAEAMVAEAKAAGARPVWLLLPDAREPDDRPDLHAMRDACHEDLRSMDATVVDLPSHWDGDLRDYFQEDRFHPNAAGCRRIAEDLSRALSRTP